MEPWYKVATPRKEVREGRSFNPDEFAIHLEQVIAKTAPEDYREPKQFFARTCFTRALREHAGMVLRRLSGETVNTAPVMTLITQFGGGKTHTLTALYHLVTRGSKAAEYPGVDELISEAGIGSIPQAKVAAFVGNAWDPQEGRETPWIDIAWQLAGEKGVKELGAAAKTTPPGTEALTRIFKAANAPVLLLFDEVLNFLNRHRGMADKFHAFIQQGGPPRGQGPHRQRRDGDQRGYSPPPVRRCGQRPYSQESFEDVCRLVLRAASATSAGVDGRGQRHDRGEGKRVPAGSVRDLLSLPPGHIVGVSAEMAGAFAVSADARDAGNAGAVDFLGVPNGVHRSPP